jgi:hypothetical protein
VDTCWSDAGDLRAPEWVQCGDPEYAGGTVLDCTYRVVLSGTPADVWPSVERIGGRSGWYFAGFLWRLRGALDRLLGGVGHLRGRRHATRLSAGDALDFWRVLEVCAPRRLVLLAEMKMPGEAVLEFGLHERSEGRTELVQRARYRPRGLLGLAYWYALVPLHEWLYRGMLRKIAASARRPVLAGPERLAPAPGTACEGGRGGP